MTADVHARTQLHRYTKQWRLDRERVGTRLVDATPVRVHLDVLELHGWTMRAIARQAGINAPMLTRIRAGQKTINRQVAETILALSGPGMPDYPTPSGRGPSVQGVGTLRRIQALLALGWPHAEMFRRSRVRTDMILARPGPHVARRTHDRIKALYADLSTKPGPSEKARRVAAERGYLSPIWWDDIDNDIDPDLGRDDHHLFGGNA